MKPTQLAILLILVAGVFLISGCRMVQEPTPTPDPAAQAAMAEDRIELVSTIWEAEYLGESDEPLMVLPDSKMTLSLLVERYAGFNGCNWFLGVYDIVSDELRFNTPATTAFLCEDEAVSTQAATYMSALVNTTNYAMEGENLVTFTVEDQRMLTFAPAVPVSFEGTLWTAKLLNDGDNSAQASSWEVTVNAYFENGKVTGFGGCNDFTADYTMDGNMISIMNLENPGNTCDKPKGINDIEDLYFNALQSVNTYDTLVASLLLSSDDGQTQILFGTP